MKALVLVMSCDLKEYPELANKQRATWDSIDHPGIQTFYYQSGPCTEICEDKLFIDIPEGAGYFYNKTILAFEYLLSMDWDYIFKTDNSAYINKEVLYNKLLDKPRENYYGGHLYQTIYTGTDPFLWGEGFAVSRDVVEFLVKQFHASRIQRTGVEDVHIGMILNQEFEWDLSLTIQEYYKHELSVNHVYRCKKDFSKKELQDQLHAMDNIHAFLHPVLETV